MFEMRKLHYAIVIMLILGVAWGCDRQGRQFDSTLDRVDALMTDHPDSALAIMQTVDTAGLSKARIARYALLLTQAQDKNRLQPKNDILIRQAVDFYCGRENIDELRSLFYYATVFYHKDEYSNALPYALIAFDMAKDQNNHFFAGMSARLMSDLYKFLAVFTEQEKYAQIAKEEFLKYEKERHIDDRYSAWMDHMIAAAMIVNEKYKEAIEVCNGVSDLAKQCNPNLKHSLWISKAEAYHRLNQSGESIEIYDSLRSDGYVMGSYNWARLAAYCLSNNDRSSAYAMLDSAYNTPFGKDTVLNSFVACRLAEDADLSRSKEALQTYNANVVELTNQLIANSPLPNVTESYYRRAEEFKRQRRNQEFLLLGVIMGSVIVIALIVLGLRKIIIHKKQENALLQSDIQDIVVINANLQGIIQKINERNEFLENDNHEIALKNETLEKEIGKLIGKVEKFSDKIEKYKQKNKDISKEVGGSIKEYLKITDFFCSLLYSVPSNDRENLRIVKKTYSRYTSEKQLTVIDNFIDVYSNGFMETIKLNFPTMQITRLRLIRYLYFGFSNETIMVLLKREDRNRMDSSRSALKRQILDKENWIGIEKETVLKKLGFYAS